METENTTKGAEMNDVDQIAEKITKQLEIEPVNNAWQGYDWTGDVGQIRVYLDDIDVMVHAFDSRKVLVSSARFSHCPDEAIAEFALSLARSLWLSLV